VRLPIHAAYELPVSIPVMALAENMAEKVARLTRRTPARDVYDLAWIASTSPHSGFDRATVRRLAVLKNWVDQYGLSSPPATWKPVAGAVPYRADRWRTIRCAADFDEESIACSLSQRPASTNSAKSYTPTSGSSQISTMPSGASSLVVPVVESSCWRRSAIFPVPLSPAARFTE
jgi:hypothetical protein